MNTIVPPGAAAWSDAAGPDDNADPLGIGDDPTGYGGFDDEGLLSSSPTGKATEHSRKGRQ